MARTLYLLIALSLMVFNTNAYEIKRVEVNSNSIGKKLHTTIVLPDSYATSDRQYSTIYLLHGWSGNDKDWTENSNVSALADAYQVILVMPDGDYDKWYINSPVTSGQNFEKYVGHDIPEFIDKKFRTIATKSGRAITGLSMGGFGALNLALNYPKTFGAVGSMSGGVDPRDYARNWGIDKAFGDPVTNARFWNDKAIINNAYQFISLNIPVFITCGTDDFFIEPNRKLHSRLAELNVKHSYLESPGGHTWTYWNEMVEYHILFMRNALENQQAEDAKKQKQS